MPLLSFTVSLTIPLCVGISMGGALGVMNESNIHNVESAADATVTSGSRRNIVDTVLSSSKTVLQPPFPHGTQTQLIPG